MGMKAIVTGGVLALGLVLAAPVWAYVICNPDGDCWHADRRETIPGVAFEIHPDDWYFHHRWNEDGFHHWREFHEGRGYWRNGVWVEF